MHRAAKRKTLYVIARRGIREGLFDGGQGPDRAGTLKDKLLCVQQTAPEGGRQAGRTGADRTPRQTARAAKRLGKGRGGNGRGDPAGSGSMPPSVSL